MEADQIRLGKEWLEEFLRLAGLPSAVSAEVSSNLPEESCWLTIDETKLQPNQVQSLIGPDGTVLDSAQYLMNAILNLGHDRDYQGAYTIELSGYRLRRFAELKAMADEAAEQVRQTGEEFELKSLSSAERRQVHTMLKEYGDLETYSRGQEPDRRLVVRLLQNES